MSIRQTVRPWFSESVAYKADLWGWDDWDMILETSPGRGRGKVWYRVRSVDKGRGGFKVGAAVGAEGGVRVGGGIRIYYRDRIRGGDRGGHVGTGWVG